MNPLIFARLGYKIDTKLSEIESKEFSFSNLKEPDFSDSKSNVIDVIKDKIENYDRQLNGSTELQPYIKKGYDYKLSNENPTLRQVVLDLSSELFSNNYLQLLLEEIDVPTPPKEQVHKITQVFLAIAKGFSIGRFVLQLQGWYKIADANRSYFSKIAFTGKMKLKKN